MIYPIENFQEPYSPETVDLEPLPVTPVPLSLVVDVGYHVRTASDGIPGVRCTVCEDKGIESWVVPGLVCSVCKTAAPAQ